MKPMQPVDAGFWIEHLRMTRHPEGGYFAETYRAPELVQAAHLPPRFGGDRAMSTAIYFLLAGDDFSSFHRIQSDEVWHFYAGSPLTVYEIGPAGQLAAHRLGPHFLAGERFQATIGAGNWFASEVADPQGYALVGCTVAPGFDFADFALARRAELAQEYPQHAALIGRLTRQ
jgi:hypothetical protein